MIKFFIFSIIKIIANIIFDIFITSYFTKNLGYQYIKFIKIII